MRFRTMALAACVTAGAMSAPLSAGVDSKDNAALRYWYAWSLLSDADKEAMESYREAVATGDHSWITSDDAAEWIQRTTIVADSLGEASLMPVSDFGIDYSKGFETLIPHVSQFRTAWRVLDVHREMALASGDVDGAVDAMATGMRMAAHIPDDMILISSLVSVSVFTPAHDRIVEALDSGELTEAHRAELLDALDRFDRVDPFGIRASILGEKVICGDWIERKFFETDLAGRERFVRDITNMDPSTDHENPVILRLLEDVRDDEKLMKQINGYRLFIDQVYEAWDNEDAPEKLRLLDKGIEEGAFGDLAMLVAPALTRAHHNDMAAQEKLNTLRSDLGG